MCFPCWMCSAVELAIDLAYRPTTNNTFHCLRLQTRDEHDASKVEHGFLYHPQAWHSAECRQTFAAVFEHLLADISADTYTLAHTRERSEVLRFAVHVSPRLVVYFTFSSIM